VLFSLVANTLVVVLHADLWYFDELGLLVFVAVSLARFHIPRDRLRMGLPEWSLGLVIVTAIASSLVGDVPASIWMPGLFLLLKGVAFSPLQPVSRHPSEETGVVKQGAFPQPPGLLGHTKEPFDANLGGPGGGRATTSRDDVDGLANANEDAVGHLVCMPSHPPLLLRSSEANEDNSGRAVCQFGEQSSILG